MSYIYKMYDKEVLKDYSITIDGHEWSCFILDDDKYYNVHIIDDFYKDEELNTLYLQEPKDCVELDGLDELWMAELIMQKYLWHKFYGFKGKSYSFTVDHEVMEEFNIENIK